MSSFARYVFPLLDPELSQQDVQENSAICCFFLVYQENNILLAVQIVISSEADSGCVRLCAKQISLKRMLAIRKKEQTHYPASLSISKHTIHKYMKYIYG